MPLVRKAGKVARSRNIKQLVKDGYSQKQAVAIAFSVGRRAAKKVKVKKKSR